MKKLKHVNLSVTSQVLDVTLPSTHFYNETFRFIADKYFKHQKTEYGYVLVDKNELKLEPKGSKEVLTRLSYSSKT